MTTSLTNSMPVMDALFRNPAFLQDFEDHIPWFLSNGKYVDKGLDPAIALAYSGDFNGLMMELGFYPKLFYPSMRLSGMTNPTDFTGNETAIKVMAPEYFDLYVNTWRAHRRGK